MPEVSMPFVTAYGNISKVLERIQAAQVPPRFSQDFLETKLNLRGGSARPLIPFLKRIGFLASDGTPTDLYRRFRNPPESGSAIAEAMRIGFSPLYEVNEYIHAAPDSQLKGIVVQVTGAEPTSSTVKSIIGSFRALNGLADFESIPELGLTPVVRSPLELADDKGQILPKGIGIKLGYTINLYLPATSDIAVFDAIFKSIRQNLM